MARRRRGRGPQFDGVLVVDKPAGMTSHDVVAAVRKAAGMSRVGHTGTLDPDATGVLVVCLGKATRLVTLLQAGQKTYTATVRFGVETSTQDASGEPLATADPSLLTDADLRAAFDQLRGEIDQVPPMVSAVKVDGERLHEKARRGEVVEREPRRVTIHELRIDGVRPGPEAEVDISVTCSAGTYVRTLGHDAGQAAGVGAHLTRLRRTHNGRFSEADAIPLDEVRAAGEERRIRDLLLDMREALTHLPSVEVDAETAVRIANGALLPPQGFAGPYRVEWDGRLLAVYADDATRAKATVVLVQPGDLATPGAGDRPTETEHA